VRVLHAAILVVRDFDAKVILVFLFPKGGDVFAFDLAVDEVLFDLVTDDDVEAIREFIGLAADEPRLDFVERDDRSLRSFM
jgi:hypothetical protein